MSKISMLSFANIRKNKGSMFTLFIFVIISAILLNTGLLLFINFSSNVDKYMDKNKAYHGVAIINNSAYKAEEYSYMKNYKGVVQSEKTDVLYTGTSQVQFNGAKVLMNITFANRDNATKLNIAKTIEGAITLKDDRVYLPSIFEIGGGYSIGDDFTINLNKKKHTLTVAGFTDEPSFNQMTLPTYLVYVNDSTYKDLAKEYPYTKATSIGVRMKNSDSSSDLTNDFLKKFFYNDDGTANTKGDVIGVNSEIYDYSTLINGRMMMPNVIAMILVAFSLLIVIVCLIFIRFRVKNTIEDGMTNIGVLKAIGYKTKQISTSVTVQFVVPAIFGSIIGIGLSYVTLPVISKILEKQSAITWKQPFDLLIALLTFAIVVISILLVVQITVLHVRKITSIKALRNGLNNHNFKKNYFPLNKTKGPLPLVVALKTLFQEKAQTIMILIIVICITFTSTAMVSVYYNLGVHTDEFLQMVAGEAPDVQLVAKTTKSAEEIMSFINKDDRVRKSFYNRDMTVMANGVLARFTGTADFSKYEGNLLYKGQYPKHDNEIALGAKLLDGNKTKIGSKYTLSGEDGAKEYIITGYIQSMNNNGNEVLATINGLKRIKSNLELKEIYIYLDDAKDAKSVVNTLKSKFKADIDNINNFVEMADAQLSVYGDMMLIITSIIVAITCVVIILVLYMILKTSIRAKRQKLGIQKAFGFTTWQLVNQMSLTYIPTVIVGVVIGSILGIIGIVPFMETIVGTMGIKSINMDPTIIGTLILGIFLILFSWICSILVSLKIKKISAYNLIVE
ncbi:MAG: ABC transporter permease [Lachnospiraceae bacterium]|jgi:putative ABC transport system permease protein|nr:ABC transporter permease [Lachnospiraceae bacterium]